MLNLNVNINLNLNQNVNWAGKIKNPNLILNGSTSYYAYNWKTGWWILTEKVKTKANLITIQSMKEENTCKGWSMNFKI
jgi:hypothetical protein